MANKAKLGWATRDITPDRPVALRGQFNLRIATRVNDPLTLTALAIENEGEQAIIVSIDTAAVDQVILDTTRELLRERDVLEDCELLLRYDGLPFNGEEIAARVRS